ncbi:MAG TPA: hypothetical protein VFA99_00610 [Acidobacteriaceae bacterium]|nr:hypothetical protein [Acidobacteriaceae bacterium]
MNVLRLSVLAAAACMLLAGCRVSTNKHANGDNVQVSTPFGSVHVKTDNDANVAGIGLTTYPGAVVVKNDDGKDKDAADINLNFGDFHLGVKAASFQTSDSPDKVEAFYRKDMARYGDVLECEGNKTVGQPTHTAQGLTCNDNDHHNREIHVSDDHDHPELRAGSPEHQHIVGIEPRDGGTKIGLVALDLPSHHGQSDSE